MSYEEEEDTWLAYALSQAKTLPIPNDPARPQISNPISSAQCECVGGRGEEGRVGRDTFTHGHSECAQKHKKTHFYSVAGFLSHSHTPTTKQKKKVEKRKRKRKEKTVEDCVDVPLLLGRPPPRR